MVKRKMRGDHRKHKTRPSNVTRRVKEARVLATIVRGGLSLDVTAQDYLECREG